MCVMVVVVYTIILEGEFMKDIVLYHDDFPVNKFVL